MAIPPQSNGIFKLLTPLGLPPEVTQELCRDLKVFHEDPQHPKRKSMKSRDPKQNCHLRRRPPAIWSYVDRELHEFLRQYGERYFGPTALTASPGAGPLYERMMSDEEISANFEALRKAMLYLSRRWRRNQNQKEQRHEWRLHVQLNASQTESLYSGYNKGQTATESLAQCSMSEESQALIGRTSGEESDSPEQSDFVPENGGSDDESVNDCNHDSTGRTSLRPRQPAEKVGPKMSIFDVPSDSDFQLSYTRRERQSSRQSVGNTPYRRQASKAGMTFGTQTAPHNVNDAKNDRPSKMVRLRVPQAKKTLSSTVRPIHRVGIGKQQQRAKKTRKSVDRLPMPATAPINKSVSRMAAVNRRIITPYRKLTGSESFPLPTIVKPKPKLFSAVVMEDLRDRKSATATHSAATQQNAEYVSVGHRPVQTEHLNGGQTIVPSASESVARSMQTATPRLLSGSKRLPGYQDCREVSHDGRSLGGIDRHESQSTNTDCSIIPQPSRPARFGERNVSHNNPQHPELIDVIVSESSSDGLGAKTALEDMPPQHVHGKSRLDGGSAVEDIGLANVNIQLSVEEALVENGDDDNETYLQKLSTMSQVGTSHGRGFVDSAAQNWTLEVPLPPSQTGSYSCKRSAPLVSGPQEDTSGLTLPPPKRARSGASTNTDECETGFKPRPSAYSRPKIVVYIMSNGRWTPLQHGDPFEHDVQSFFVRIAEAHKLQDSIEAIEFFCPDAVGEKGKRYRLLRDDELGYLNIFINKIAAHIKKQKSMDDFRVLVEPQVDSDEEEGSDEI